MQDMSVEQNQDREQQLPQITPVNHAENGSTRVANFLSSGVETQLLPPERFKKALSGEVKEIAKIRETLAVVYSVKNPENNIDKAHTEGVIYDKHGRALRIMLDPTGDDIANAATTDIALGGAHNSWAEMPEQLFSRLGFDKSNTDSLVTKFNEQVKSFWQVNSNQAKVDKDRFKKDAKFSLTTSTPWRLTVSENKEAQEVFVFTSGETFFLVDPQQPEKQVIVKDKQKPELKDKEAVLPSDKKLLKENTVFSILGREDNELATFTGTSPVQDPDNPTIIYYLNTGRIHKLNLTGVETRASFPQALDHIEVKDPQELAIDPHGNFFVIRTSENTLEIRDKNSGELIKSFNEAKGPVIIDEQGDIIYVDNTGNLREIQTNFQAIPPGGTAEAKKNHERALQELQERFSKLNLDEVTKTGEAKRVSEESVAQTLRSSLDAEVSPKIASAESAEEVEKIFDTLITLKNEDAYEGYETVIDEFVTKAREKLGAIQLSNLEESLTKFVDTLSEVKSVTDTIGLDQELSKLLELRQRTEIENIEKRREIEGKIQNLQSRRDRVITKYQGQLLEALDESFVNVDQLLQECGSLQELNNFSMSLSGQQFEIMLSAIHDPDKRREWRQKYSDAKEQQRTKLYEQERQFDEQQRMRWAQVVQEAREDMETIRDEIQRLNETREVERFNRHPLVASFQQKLMALPPEVRELEEKKLEVLLNSRRQDIEHRKQLGAVGEQGELKFGKASFPVYKEPPRIWQPKFEPIGRNAIWSRLVFEDDQGHKFDPEPENHVLVTPDVSDEKTKDKIDYYRQKAEEYFRNLQRDIPHFNDKWVISDYQREKLEELVEILNLQRENHRGIAILAGEAGTGKNVLVDMLASLSNREVTTIACNKNTAKEDLTFEFYFDPDKGTYKIPSKLVDAIQKPGTVVLFDEINTLPPGVVKMLNSTFDYRRTMYINEGGKQKRIDVDPSVLFIGTMNPQNYQGVTPLSPEVKSRARVIDVDYPPFESRQGGRDQRRVDEALILSRLMDGTEDLTPDEFKSVWDNMVNGDKDNGADTIIATNKKIQENTERIYNVLRVANRLREWYRAYQTGENNEPMDFPVSLREVTDIAMEMNDRKGTAGVIKRVILPKIDDRGQRKMVLRTIDQILQEPE